MKIFFIKDAGTKLGSVAYMDGYAFGNRLLEDVPVRTEIIQNMDGSYRIVVGLDDKDPYCAKLNITYWNKLANDYAQECDSFYTGEDLHEECFLTIEGAEPDYAFTFKEATETINK